VSFRPRSFPAATISFGIELGMEAMNERFVPVHKGLG
jgi:hypothetical protein